MNIRKQLLAVSISSAIPLVLVGALALYSLWRNFNGAEVSAELFVRARRVFEAAFLQFKAREDLRVSTLVLEGSAKQKITEEAEEWKADLIVVGSHGYNAFQRMLLGSVSHAVAQHAKCTVEIARATVD